LVDVDNVCLDRRQASCDALDGVCDRPGSREIEIGDNFTSEVEALLCALPEEICGQLPDIRGIRPRLAAIAGCDRSAAPDPATQLRLRLLDGYLDQLVDLDESAERSATGPHRARPGSQPGARSPWSSATMPWARPS
jgi:hypothetical protein